MKRIEWAIPVVWAIALVFAIGWSLANGAREAVSLSSYERAN